MKALGLLAVAALLLLVVPSVALAGPVIVYEGWGTPTQQLKARPGYTNYPFTVEITGAVASYGELNLTGLPFTNTTYGEIARASPESASPLALTFFLNVNRSAQPGVYSLPLKLFLTNGSTMSMAVQAVVSQAPVVSVAQASWAEPAYPGSGQQELVLMISNPTDDPVSLVTLRIGLANGVYNMTGGTVAYAYVEGIEPHSFYQAEVPLNVSEGASPGTYRFNYTASFFDEEGVEYSSSGSFSVYITTRPEVQVSLAQLSIGSGSEGALNVTVKNVGASPVYDVAVSLSVNGLELVGGNVSTISYMGPGSSSVRTFVVYAPQQAQPGVYPAIADVSYAWSGGEASVSSIGQVSVTSQTPVQVNATPSAIVYERNNSVVISVTNELGSPISDVRVSLAAQGLAYLYPSSGEFSLGAIQPGSSRSIKVYVLPYGQEGSLPLQVTVTYQNQLGASESYAEAVGLFVMGLPQVSITQLSIPTATNGTSETVSGVILNSGTAEAYYGTVTIYVPSLGVNESEYIGDLPTDSPTPFSFTFQVPAGASGSYAVRLGYTYQDQYGNSYSTSAVASLLVLQGHVATQAHHIGYDIVYLAVLVVIGFIIGFVVGRLRRK